MQKGQTRKQSPRILTLANRSCNRNEVFVKGFSADQKRELVRDLRNKYRGVRITRDSRGEYIVYDDDTRDIRSTYLSPAHLVVPNARLRELKITKKSEFMVRKSAIKYDAMDLVRKLDFSVIYNAPRKPKTIIEGFSQEGLNTKQPPRKKPVDIVDILDKTSLPRDSMLNRSRTSPSLNLSLKPEEKELKKEEKESNEEEKELKEEEKKLNRFIDDLLSASHQDFDKIFESEIEKLNQERIATLMIERFKRRKQELDEITKSNQLSTAQFLERYLYSDPKDQTPKPQAQDSEAQTAQDPQPKTKNSKDEFQRDARKIARQIFFKDRWSESLFQEYQIQEYQKSQTSLSVSSQDPVNQSLQSASQDRSQKSATSPSNISRISRNIYGDISRDYVRSSTQNRLTSAFLNKFKEKFSESFERIYNKSISHSSSQLLPEQVSSDANSSVAIIAGAGSLESVQGENLDDPNSRSRSPGSASRRVTSHPFASSVEVSSTSTRPPGMNGLDLRAIEISGDLNLSSVALETGIGNGSGRGLILDTPRNTQSAPSTARGLRSSISQGEQTNRSAPANLENYTQSLIQFQDAVENPNENVDQNLTNFIEKFILETSVQNSVSQSLDQSLDQSSAESPKNSISHELEKITQARIVGLMKQKFSEFKANYLSQNTQNSQRKINPDLYRKFLFETNENGDDLQPPRTARSNSKMTVLEICKALAICLVEAENIPNEIVSPQSSISSLPYPEQFIESPQSTIKSPPSPISNQSIISYSSDYGGNVMSEILTIFNDQKQSNLKGKSFEQQPDQDQSISDQENSVNQDQEDKIINCENFTQLLERLNGIVSPEDKKQVVGGELTSGELFDVKAYLGFLSQHLNNNSSKGTSVELTVKLGFPSPVEPPQTLKNGVDNKISPPSPTQDPQNSSDGNEVGGEENTTPPPSPNKEKGSPSTLAARNAAIVSSARIEGVFLPNAQGDSDSGGNEAGGTIIQEFITSISDLKKLFENKDLRNAKTHNSDLLRPPARIINMQSPPQTPVTVIALFLPLEREVSPTKSPLYQTIEGAGQGSTASPAFTASTEFACGGSPVTSGYSPTASLKTVSPQGLSSVTTSNSGSPPISPVSVASADGSEGVSQTASHPSSPALVGASAVESVEWVIEEVQAVQVLFEYSIISQDHQDDVNDQTNPKKDYDFFIQKSQEDEGENTENKKTKIAILKTKFEDRKDNKSLTIKDTIKENKARELVKKAIIKAIEITKEIYSSQQNPSSSDDKIYYDYLEIAIDVGGVKNKEFQFKNALRQKGITETEIGDHFEKAKLLSENFQKIAMTEFGIFTGRIGEAKSRVVGMRTKRIPLDLLKEVRRECSQPSNSPQDPDSQLTWKANFQSK